MHRWSGGNARRLNMVAGRAMLYGAIERIDSFKGEILYWIATLISNTLGTSSGDFMSHTLRLGFRASSLVLIVAMLVILAAHYRTKISTTVLFWVAYVLTRPLGAVAENAVSVSAGFTLTTWMPWSRSSR